MNRSSFYNPIWCPSTSAELRWFEIPCQMDKVACRACARIPDVIIPCFVPPNFRNKLSSAELWFVELAYRACVTDARNPGVNSSAAIQRQCRNFDVIKSPAFECVREHSRSCVEVSTILGDVMDSRNSKTIEQLRCDSGRRLGDREPRP